VIGDEHDDIAHPQAPQDLRHSLVHHFKRSSVPAASLRCPVEHVKLDQIDEQNTLEISLQKLQRGSQTGRVVGGVVWNA